MSDSFFMTKTIIKNDIETTVQIHKKDVNMYQHIRSQFCLMHKLGLSNENNFNFKNIPFKSRVS
ncbi:MAG: hypothetical protein RSF67_02940 [Clostridia bacterium]